MLITAGGLILAGLVVSWIVGGRLIAPAPLIVGDSPASLPGRNVTIESTAGSTVAGWHVSAEGNNGVVVLLHGIRANRRAMIERAEFLYAAGYSIVMIDMHAHGETPGNHITLGRLESRGARAAVDFARREHPTENIAVIGVSLGGASALLASPLGIDALILEAVFPTISDAVHNRVAAQLGPLSYVPASLLLLQLKPRLNISPGQLRPIDHVRHIGCPVFVMCGEDDLHTTAQEAQQMFEAAAEPKQFWLVPNATHVDLHKTACMEYESRVLDFLHQNL